MQRQADPAALTAYLGKRSRQPGRLAWVVLRLSASERQCAKAVISSFPDRDPFTPLAVSLNDRRARVRLRELQAALGTASGA